MTREAFDALVQRLERQAERAPHWYLTKVGGLTLLGYANEQSLKPVARKIATVPATRVYSRTP